MGQGQGRYYRMVQMHNGECVFGLWCWCEDEFGVV